MKRLIVVATATACLFSASALLAGGVQAAGSGDPCAASATAPNLIRAADGTCVDSTPPSPQAQRLAAAKEAYATALDAVKHGHGSQQAADRAKSALDVLLGTAANSQQVVPLTATLPVPSYQQINGNYCGPAMAENILRFLWGANPSYGFDPVTGTHDVLTGNTMGDQGILANSHWLDTASLQETPWTDSNTAFVPFTLNNFTSTIFYVSTFHTYLTESSAWVDIDSDFTTYSHPVSENVFYGDGSYLPPGFAYNGPTGYWHWDTIFGDNSTFWAAIAQSYASLHMTRTPYYWKDWADQWNAINIGHGIVW